MNHVIVIAAIALLVLLFLKVPVYISVLAASVIYFIGSPNVNSMVFAQQVLAGSQGLSLLAIPFFVMAGVFMNYTGVTRRIMECCNVLTSRCVMVPGVTTRMTSRFTRPFASFGSSICSAIATL